MRDTAEAQLERVFYLLSAASLHGGATFAELAEALGVSRQQAARDATELADRVLYHPPGGTAGGDILVDRERVRVVARGSHFRPMRLSPGEAAALALGLRSMSLEAGAERAARLRELAGRLERFAARAPVRAPTAADPDARGPEGVHDRLRDAATRRRACRIEYLKPGAGRPAARVVHPYLLVHAERWWYVLGPDVGDGRIRHFRLDRIVSAEVLDEEFRVPAGFRPAAHLPDGRAFTAADAPEVVVRYAPAAAAYVREKWPGAEPDGAGGCIVRHRAADTGWVIRHVLQYGPDAEVLSPPAMRSRVARAAREIADRWERLGSHGDMEACGEHQEGEA